MCSRSLDVNSKGNSPISFHRCLLCYERTRERWFYKWDFLGAMNSLPKLLGLIYRLDHLYLLFSLGMPRPQHGWGDWGARKGVGRFICTDLRYFHHPAMVCATVPLSGKLRPCHVYGVPCCLKPNHNSSPIYSIPSFSHSCGRPNACFLRY